MIQVNLRCHSRLPNPLPPGERAASSKPSRKYSPWRLLGPERPATPTDPSSTRVDTPSSRGNRQQDSTMGGAEQTAGWGLTFLPMFLPSLALYGFLAWSLVH